MDRRTFLSALLAAPCVSFAGRFSFCQEADKGPEWYRAALRSMTERRSPGIVLVGPIALEDQSTLGLGLWAAVDGKCTDAHEIFLTSAFICLTPDLAAQVGLRKPDEKANRILIDGDGRRLAADLVPLDVFAKPETFAVSFDAFLHGADLARLKERAARARKSLPEEARLAIELLDSENVESRDRAVGTLQKLSPDFFCVFALEHRTTASAEVRGRLKSILESQYQAAATDKVDGRLPYGTRLPEFKEGSCGGVREIPDPAPEDGGEMIRCGMARISDPDVKKLLRFLTK